MNTIAEVKIKIYFILRVLYIVTRKSSDFYPFCPIVYPKNIRNFWKQREAVKC